MGGNLIKNKPNPTVSIINLGFQGASTSTFHPGAEFQPGVSRFQNLKMGK
jgi:hypothetical protein